MITLVELLEVKDWTTLKSTFRIDVKSLEDLRRVAEGLNIPFIVHKGKEYLVFCGHMLGIPVCYRFKK